jgi:glycosyltransferase involved in cell wall biosynthesis
MPTVSVIVPNFNHARYLRQRIDTILAQTYQDFELILLDDCSTDESRAILSEYASDPRIRLDFNTVNSGSTFKQWNKGVRLARGKFVWIAESDDYSDPRFLETLVSRLETDDRIALAYCRSRYVAGERCLDAFPDSFLSQTTPGQWESDFCADGPEMCRKYFYRQNAIANASAVVFRRDAYLRVGAADETFQYCGDWKMWAALSLEGKICYFSRPLNYFRLHDASVRAALERTPVHVAESLRVTVWVLHRVSLPQEALDDIRKALARSWGPAVLSFRTPVAARWQIAMQARALDPKAFRRFLGPAITTVHLKLLRHWRAALSLIRLRKYARS